MGDSQDQSNGEYLKATVANPAQAKGAFDYYNNGQQIKTTVADTALEILARELNVERSALESAKDCAARAELVAQARAQRIANIERSIRTLKSSVR